MKKLILSFFVLTTSTVFGQSISSELQAINEVLDAYHEAASRSDWDIYIAFMNYDSDPNAIVSRFSRRDSWAHSEGMRGGSASGINNSDWIGVAIDSRNDNLTGYSFIVNAAGSKLDTYMYDDSRYDTVSYTHLTLPTSDLV